MRNITKKMMISILTTVIILITMVATTYAWVGIFTYSSTGNFQMNLKIQDLEQDYFLVISNTGDENTFSEEISQVEIKREILVNRGIESQFFDVETASSDEILKIFDRYSILQCSTTSIVDNELTDFKTVNMSNTKRFEYLDCNDYYKVDIYLSVDTKEGIQDNTEVNSNVFISDIEDTLKGTIGQFRFINGNPFNELPSNSMSDVLKNLSFPTFNVNSANAARFALSVYNPIDIKDSYDDNAKPLKTLIYQGGSYVPIYDAENDVYDLGGNLPEDYNAALQDLFSIRPNYNNSTVDVYKDYYNKCLEEAVVRGTSDLELNDENSMVWEAPNNFEDSSYLGVYNGKQTKMKIEIYFWFEGWDADCLRGISKCPVDFNLVFTAHKNDLI